MTRTDQTSCLELLDLGSYNVPTGQPHETVATQSHTSYTYQSNSTIAFES